MIWVRVVATLYELSGRSCFINVGGRCKNSNGADAEDGKR